jgi:hypothetical protein
VLKRTRCQRARLAWPRTRVRQTVCGTGRLGHCMIKNTPSGVMGAGLKYVTVGLVRTGASAATIAATKTAAATKAKQLRVDAIAGLAPARQRS